MVRRSLAAVAAGLVLLLGACGTGANNPSGASAATTTRPAAGPTTSVGVDPNAPEVNPAGDIPDNQIFVPYRPPGGRFMVKVPEGWARTVRGGTVSFTDKLNTIRLESRPPGRAARDPGGQPALRTGEGHPGAPRRRTGRAHHLPGRRPGRPGHRKVVHDAVERYEFWRDGTEAILTLAGPVGADNVDPWRIVTDSFRWR